MRAVVVSVLIDCGELAFFLCVADNRIGVGIGEAIRDDGCGAMNFRIRWRASGFQPDENIGIGHAFDDGANFLKVATQRRNWHARRKLSFFHRADKILRYTREANQTVDGNRWTS